MKSHPLGLMWTNELNALMRLSCYIIVIHQHQHTRYNQTIGSKTNRMMRPRTATAAEADAAAAAAATKKHRKFSVSEWASECVRCTPFVPSPSSCRATVDNDSDHDHDDGFTSVCSSFFLRLFVCVCVFCMFQFYYYSRFFFLLFFSVHFLCFFHSFRCVRVARARVSFSHGMDFRWPYIHGNSTHKALCLCRAIMRSFVRSFFLSFYVLGCFFFSFLEHFVRKEMNIFISVFVTFVQCNVHSPRACMCEYVFVFTLCIPLLFLWSNTNETVTNSPTSKQIDKMRERTNLIRFMFSSLAHLPDDAQIL